VLNGLDNGGTAIWKLYEQDGGSWAVRGTTALEFGVKNNVTLIIEPGSTDAHATGYDLNAVTWQMLLPADGSPAQEEWKLQGARGQGREMHGTVGADGLHLIYRDEDPGLVYHLHSLTGSPWIFEGNPFSGATDLDLGATSEGEVYASGILSGNSAELHYWDGATWSMQLAWPTIAGFRPSLSDTRLEDIIHWAVYIQPTGNIRYAKGSQTTPFTFTAVAPDVGPVWDGTVCNAGYSMSYAELFTMAGSTAPSQSDFGLYGWYEPSFYEVLINTPVSPTPQDWGRVLDSCIYSNGYGTVRSFWVACATIGPSMIIDYYRDGERAIPLPHEFTLGDFTQYDIRRTVSTAYAWGGTALGLNCDLFGQTPIFMWSDFGDWEPLPMPPGLNPGEGGYISKPELIVGDDGRWHILYHDYDTDQIMVRSTI